MKRRLTVEVEILDKDAQAFWGGPGTLHFSVRNIIDSLPFVRVLSMKNDPIIEDEQ